MEKGGRSKHMFLHLNDLLGQGVDDDDNDESESESERYLFDPHKKLIQSNNEKQLGSGDPY